MNRQRAFTLIELLITLTVVSVLMVVGVPSYREMMRNNRIAAHTNEFTSAINYTRNEAVKRGRSTVLCPSTDQATCTGGTNWAAGWLTFVDANSNGSLDTGTGTRDTVLRVSQQMAGDPVFTGPATLGYRPTGELTAGAAQQFDYTLGPTSQCMLINLVGRSHVQKDPSQCP